MVVIRFLSRFLLFMIGLGAIALMFGIGFVFLQAGEDASIVVAEGQPVLIDVPSSPEDLVICAALQLRADEVNAPVSDDSSEVAFTVPIGASALDVSLQLQSEGLVADADLFRRYLRCNGLDASLEAGDYTLRRNMNMPEVGAALQEASFEEVVVTIPEGLRAEQVAEILAEEGIMQYAEFMQVVQAGNTVQHNLLSDKPGGASYEGYLFPDTYRLPANASPEDLIERMLDNLAARLPANTFDLAAQQGMSFFQILTVASIVEREAVIAEERPTIASVYLNRLKPDSPVNYLQADPTVQYAMGYQPEADQWWKTPVTLEEYQTIDSPYNTYLTPGLPPTPIASPGIGSIIATLQPAETNYYFFVAFENGAHVFAETFEEHEQNVARYLGQ